MKKILFISAINPASEVERRYPDLGLAYLAGSLRDAFGAAALEIRIINEKVDDVIEEFAPDLIGIRAVSQNYNFAKKYAREAKKHGVPVLIGGVHISSLPMTLTEDMDAGCIGEGERTIVELVRLFLETGKLAADGLSKIQGIVYHDGERLCKSKVREPIVKLDTVAKAAKDLLALGHHSYLFTSRGCPYRCVFCSSSIYWDKLRFFSAERVVEEIHELVDVYGVKLISFYDDLFVANTKRLKEIVALLEKTDLLDRVKFTCSSSATKITEETVKALKAMNIVSVGMGLESGCERTLKYLKGEAFSVENNSESIRLLNKYGISANASFVIGSPEETEADIMETYAFIRDNPLSLVDVYVITPYPGTAIWEYAKKRELVSDDMDWAKLNINFEVNSKNAIILSETLSREKILALYKRFRRQRLIRNLKNIWYHPFIMDVPKVAFRTAKERVLRYFNELCSSGKDSKRD
jgi:radical SAM superfamily enzyme YgiQ (UPF0313 family)